MREGANGVAAAAAETAETAEIVKAWASLDPAVRFEKRLGAEPELEPEPETGPVKVVNLGSAANAIHSTNVRLFQPGFL